RGSMRIASAGRTSAYVCVCTSEPSAKRNHLTVKYGAPADCTTSGVVHPFAPPSVRVTFGRYSFSANALDALTAIAVAGLRAAPTTANLPPKMSADQSPSVIAVDAAASKAQTDPGASDGPVTGAAAVTPSPWRRR